MSQRVKKRLFVLCVPLTLLLPPLRRSLWAAALSLLLAWLLRRGAARLEARGLPRRWAAAAVALSGAALGVLALWAGLVAVFGVLNRAACVLPDPAALFERLQALSDALPDGLSGYAAQGVRALERRSASLREQAVLRAARLSAHLLSRLPQSAFFLLVVGLSAFYAAADWERVKPLLRDLVPEDWRSPIRSALALLRQGVKRFLAVQGRLMLLQFLVLTAGLLLLGERGAGGVAALAALTDVLPLLGTGAVLLPLSALRLLEGQTRTALGLWLLTACCWTLRTALEPRLVGRQAGLSPFFTLLALYLGAACFGVPGVAATLILASALDGVGVESLLASKREEEA